MMETILDSPSSLTSSHSGYAGFWIRVVAVFIDGLVLSIPQWLLIYAAFGSLMGPDPSAGVGGGMLALQFGGIAMGWLYSALMESSANQATLGKMALGLKVTDLEGERISFAKASGRHFSKIISGLILLIGFIMVAFTEKKQGLHDQIAGTLVVKK